MFQPSTTSGRRSSTGRILRFSDVDIPPPDFNAPLSSPPVVLKSALKSAPVKKMPMAEVPAKDASLDSSPALVVASRPTRSAESVRARANDVLDGLSTSRITLAPCIRLIAPIVPASSSPTPGAKKSVKAGLRKKDQLAADTEITGIKPMKRKAILDNADDDAPLAPCDKDVTSATRPTKRARTRTQSGSLPDSGSVDASVVLAKAAPNVASTSPLKRSGGSVVPPRAMQVRKRYRARKGRASSPSPEAIDDSSQMSASGLLAVPATKLDCADVDYDELPAGPAITAAISLPPVNPTHKHSGKETAIAKRADPIAKQAKLQKPAPKADIKVPGRKKKTDKTGQSVDIPNENQAAKAQRTTRAKTAVQHGDPGKRASAEKGQRKQTETDQATANLHKLNDVATLDATKPNTGEGNVEPKASARVPPRPRRAAAAAMKVWEEDVIDAAKTGESACVVACSSDQVPVIDLQSALATGRENRQKTANPIEAVEDLINWDNPEVPAPEGPLSSDSLSLPVSRLYEYVFREI